MSDARPPRDASRTVVAAALAASLLVTALVTGAGCVRSPASVARSLAFQRLVGGLGTGLVMDAGDDPHALDARLGRAPFGGDLQMRSGTSWNAGARSRGE